MKIFISILVFLISINANNSNRISIIYINDNTLKKYGSYPLSRDFYAKFINSIYKNYTPKVVSMNIIFDLYDEVNPQLDQKLFDSVKGKYNLVFLGSISKKKLNHEKYYPWSINSNEIRTKLKMRKGAFFPLPKLLYNGASLGIGSFFYNGKEGDSFFPLIYNIEGIYYPSLALSIIQLYDQRHKILYDDRLERKYDTLYNIQKGNYYPKLTYTFDIFSYDDILEYKVDKKYIDNRIILFGTNIIGISKNNDKMTGTMFLANTLESILNKESKLYKNDDSILLVIGLIVMIIFLSIILIISLKLKNSGDNDNLL